MIYILSPFSENKFENFLNVEFLFKKLKTGIEIELLSLLSILKNSYIVSIILP